jgi:small-conductance mechanosensitive channel
MSQWIQWLVDNWLDVVIPAIALLACYVVGLWLRRIAFRVLSRWIEKAKWEGGKLVVETTRRHFLYWFLLLGAYIAIHVSILPPAGKTVGVKVIGSLFILSLMWVAARLSERLLKLYLPKMKVPQPPVAVMVNIARVVVIVFGILVLLDIWGAPTTPIVLVLAAGLFIAGLALRDVIPNLFLGAQVVWGEQIKVGDFIGLGSGDTGGQFCSYSQ